jgi:hypothetical protein
VDAALVIGTSGAVGTPRCLIEAEGRYAFKGRLPARTPLDGVYDLDGALVGVEVKNWREWVYPMSETVWVMVRKCLELDAVPLLVCRKMAYVNRVMFGRLGMLGFEFYRQVFSERVAHLLPPIQHKDRLGYKDVIAVSQAAHDPLVRFLRDTVARQLPTYRERWERNRELLTEFAVNRGLGDSHTPARERQHHEPAFFAAVFGTEEVGPDEL